MNRDRARTPTRVAGFSVIELMTVLVVLAVSASLAIPSLSSYVDRNRTRSALDRFVGDVAFARLYAVENGRRSAIRIQGDGTYTIDTLSTGGDWAPVRTVRIGSDDGGVSIGGAVTTLVFTSRGILTNQDTEAVFTASRGDHRDSVFVSPAGRVYRDF